MNNRVYIRTFGCQMNEYDSEILQGLLRMRGFEPAENLESADIALFNTCSVREHAERRVYGKVGMLKKLKTPSSKLKIIGVIGCMAQAHKERIFKELPHVDLVCGPHEIYQIPDYLNEIIRNRRQIIAVDEKERPADRDNQELREFNQGIKAFVTIMEGCNNFCSYCIVPFVRGREKSRPPALILKEIERLIKRGVKEITLLGQNVNSYGKDFKNGYKFIDLLKDVDRIGELKRLRFVTNHPKDVSKDMFEVMAKLPTICEHIHLPVQSGSDKILKSMNRKYTSKEYLDKVNSLRDFIPYCSLSTDIIVGYPQETDEDFKKTKEIMEIVQFDGAYIFKYSPRPYSEAHKLKDDVPQKIKEERNQQLLALQREITRKNNQKFLEKVLGVLVEGVSNKCDKLLVGRTRSDKVVVFEGPKELIGKIVEVQIKGAQTATLLGNWKRW